MSTGWRKKLNELLERVFGSPRASNHLARESVADDGNSNDSRRLTKIVKRFLDLIWFILLFTAIVWPIAMIVIGLNIPSDPEQRTTDVNVFLAFKIYPDVAAEPAADSTSAAGALISGRGEVKIDNTRGLLAWYLAGAITEVMGLIALFGLAQMRRLFASLLRGESFARENADRISKIGYAFIAWHIILPLLQYFGGRAVLHDIGFNVQGIQLNPAFEFNIVGIFTGLAIIVLAGVSREAASMHQEQSLTI